MAPVPPEKGNTRATTLSTQRSPFEKVKKTFPKGPSMLKGQAFNNGHSYRQISYSRRFTANAD